MQADDDMLLMSKHKNSENTVTSLFPLTDNNVSKLPSFETFQNATPGETNNEGMLYKLCSVCMCILRQIFLYNIPE